MIKRLQTRVKESKVEVPGVEHTRDQWQNRYFFLISAIGSSIGLGNIWRFPYMTYKHGGWVFIIAYAVALFTVGVPMLILELALGQKM